MKRRIWLFVLIAVAIIPLIPGGPLSDIKSAHATTNWQSSTAITTTNPYACVIWNGYIYCLDISGHAYSNTESSSGVGGSWTSGTSYLKSVSAPPTCVVSSGFETCIGGNGTSTVIEYSQLSAGSWGAWATTTAYPIGIEDTTCVVALSRIYCIAGYSSTATSPFNSPGPNSNTYYATLTSGQVGTWTQTTSYPNIIYDQVCSTTASAPTTVICAGGTAYDISPAQTCCSTNSANSFMATLSSSGISAWSSNAWLPQAQDFGSCVGLTSYIYCMGGRSICVPINCTTNGGLLNDTILTSPTLFPNWQTDTNWFPIADAYGIGGCATDGTNIFCVGGYITNNFGSTTTAVEYTTVTSLPSTITWTQQPTSIIGQTVEACGIDTISTTIFCVGQNRQTEYAALSPSGGAIGTWHTSTAYPFVAGVTNFDTAPPSIVVAGGYIYGIGGYCVTQCSTNGQSSNGVFSAPVSGSGIGAWTQQGNYPSIVYGVSCVPYSGDIFCVGGAPSGTTYLANTYVATATAGTVGTWNGGTAYPLTSYGTGCANIGTNLYCTSGLGKNAALSGHASSYTAVMTTVAPYIGSWTQKTDYPIGKTGITGLYNVNCIYNGIKIYCLGGDWWSVAGKNEGAVSYVYSTTDGMTTWNRETNLPYSTMYFYTGGISDANGILYTVGGMLFSQDSPNSFKFTTQVWSTGTAAPVQTTTETGNVLFQDNFQYGYQALSNGWVIDQYAESTAGAYTQGGFLIVNGPSTPKTVHIGIPSFSPNTIADLQGGSYAYGTIVDRKLTIAGFPFAQQATSNTAVLKIGFSPLLTKGAFPSTTPYGTPYYDTSSGSCNADGNTNDSIGTEYLMMNNNGAITGVTCGDGGFINHSFSSDQSNLYTIFTIETQSVFCLGCSDHSIGGTNWSWMRVYQENSNGTIVSDQNFNFTSNVAPLYQTSYVFISLQTNGSVSTRSTINLVNLQNHFTPIQVIPTTGIPLPKPNDSGFPGLFAQLALLFGNESLGGYVLFGAFIGIVIGMFYFTRSFLATSMLGFSITGAFSYMGLIDAQFLYLMIIAESILLVRAIMKMIGIGGSEGDSEGSAGQADIEGVV